MGDDQQGSRWREEKRIRSRPEDDQGGRAQGRQEGRCEAQEIVPDYLSLPTFAGPRDVHVVVETPRHAQAKFKFEPTLGVFVLSRALSLGLSYPYDWGFVPSTAAPDRSSCSTTATIVARAARWIRLSCWRKSCARA